MNKDDDALNLFRIFLSLKRGLKIIFVSIASLFVLCVLYVLITPPQYSASASILLDRTQADTVAELSSNARRSFEHAAIESQVEILKSRRVTEQAMEYLYSEAEREALERDYVEREALIKRLQNGLRVRREGESHVLTVRYFDTDPNVAADRANAYSEAYIYDQINYFSEGSVKTATWLQKKIESQREQSIAATRAVQKFRLNNDLIDSGGSTMNEQRLTNMNNKLANAKAAVAAAEVRYNHSKSIVENNDISAAVAEAFDNNVINGIRAKYLENEARLSRLIETLGEDHNAVKNQRSVLNETRDVIFGEMKRIVQSYQNEYEVAVAEVQALTENLNVLIEKKVQNDTKKFELDALEKEAETHQKLYEDYLEKFQTVNGQQSFPVAQSRIITYAVPPLHKSYPKVFVLLTVSLILGGGLGCFLALLKDNFDATIRRAGQVESTLGLFFLGFLPQSVSKPSRQANGVFAHADYTKSTDAPRSIHADTCKNIKGVFEKRGMTEQTTVIGVISDRPNAAKSMTASNVAQFLAAHDEFCLLIDADHRRPALTRENRIQRHDEQFSATQDHHDVQQKLVQKFSLGSYFARDPETNLFILPADCSEFSEIDIMRFVQNEIRHEASEIFDYVVIDLPPLCASADTALFSRVIDSYIVVLEWGKTLPNQLEFHLKQSGIEKEKIIGAVIGETDMKEMVENYRHSVHPDYISV